MDALETQEGRTNFMYRDSRGIVSCGIGHALFSVDDALKLPWDQPAAQVRADYAAVKAAPANHTAPFYAPLTKSRLSQQFVDDLEHQDIEQEISRLKRHYPFFDSFPAQAKQALQDMAVNLGGDFPPHWPHFSACVLDTPPDWKGAAANCRRKPPISDERNRVTEQLFIEAANA